MNNTALNFNSNAEINSNNNNTNKIETKIEPVNNPPCIAPSEQQQNKSLMNDKNPFLQKATITQNSLFSSKQ